MRLSLVVMAYRQEAFIADTIAAAFAQDHPDLEIVLTDDSSPDGTFRVMEEMAAAYQGPHKIVLNRNPQNLGLIGHVNRLFDLATSDWLIYNAGDDLSEPHRARVIAETIARDGPKYVYSDATQLDPDGSVAFEQPRWTRHGFLEAKPLPDLARLIDHAFGATSAWHRDLFTRFGPIHETKLFEDQVLMFRARLIGRISFVEDRLLRYRRGIGLSFLDMSNRLDLLGREVNVLRQRYRDTLAFDPSRRDILRSIEGKRDRREREIAALLASAPEKP
jgi:glycosyltransferase involved in cell wall biosynthesis